MRIVAKSRSGVKYRSGAQSVTTLGTNIPSEGGGAGEWKVAGTLAAGGEVCGSD